MANKNIEDKTKENVMEDGENLAFVFPPKLSSRIKQLQKDLGLRSASEVLLKAISLLEISSGRKVEITEDSNKWEINEFEEFEKTVHIKSTD